jgi:hypothetical protein
MAQNPRFFPAFLLARSAYNLLPLLLPIRTAASEPDACVRCARRGAPDHGAPDCAASKPGKITPSALIERKRDFQERLLARVAEHRAKLLARKGGAAKRAGAVEVDVVADIEPAGAVRAGKSAGKVCMKSLL